MHIRQTLGVFFPESAELRSFKYMSSAMPYLERICASGIGKRLKNLVIAIPAYNEEKVIARTVYLIRRAVTGWWDPTIVVVDDGSTDDTANAARSAGADRVVRHSRNMGVAVAYRTAIEYSVSIGADVLCTIDADMQFNPKEIPSLVEPILRGHADVTVGSRFLDSRNSKRVPLYNAIGNRLMAMFLSLILGRRLSDVESGFRALSKNAAKSLGLIGIGSFSHDMLIDLIQKGFRVTEVPVSVRYYDSRESRVIGGFLRYGFKSLCMILMKKIVLSLNLRLRFRSPRNTLVVQ